MTIEFLDLHMTGSYNTAGQPPANMVVPDTNIPAGAAPGYQPPQILVQKPTMSVGDSGIHKIELPLDIV